MTHDKLLECGRTVLKTEAAALVRLADQLGDSFASAVEMLVACKGRAIITGMGKSGHVGRKLAATLASTGTPAYYVHPGEASHGDLGMITKEDVIVALSYSGETKELSDLIEYSRRFSIPLISITHGETSALALASDVLILLQNEPEIALGHAPTTSTTMMLALGDALAVAALESKGFTKADYRNFHPGGKLGQTLMRVHDVMHKDGLPLVPPQDKMADVLVVMTEKSFGCVGVVDEKGLLIGIITDGDLRRHMKPDLLEKRADEVMTRDPMTVEPRLLAAEALKILNEKKRTNLFVVLDGKPVGLLHVHDLLRAGIA